MMNLFNRTFVLCIVFLSGVVHLAIGFHTGGRGKNKAQSRPPAPDNNNRFNNDDRTDTNPEDMTDVHFPAPVDTQEVYDSLINAPNDEATAQTPLTIESECPTCYLRREEAKLLRIEYVKRTILEKLQMTSPPNNSHNIVLPKNAELTRFMNQYFTGPSDSRQSDQPQTPSTLEPSTRIEKMILFPKRPPSQWNINENTSYAFTFSEKLFSYDVKDASLHVHIRPRRSAVEGTVYYLIIRRVYEPQYGSSYPKIKSSSRKRIILHPPRGEWVAFNLTSVAQEWLDYPEEHNVIQISLIDEFGNSHDDLLDTNIDSEYRKRSFLMMNIKEKRYHRFRRATNESPTCAANSLVRSCCKYDMLINFDEIGWDWIIAPRNYDANYCHGECPHMYMLQYAHTHIVESIGSTARGGTGPCCSPRQMSDLQMLHTDQKNNIQFTTISAMKVESCHCA